MTSSFQQDIEQAGLVTAAGHIEVAGVVSRSPILPAEVEVRGEFLAWRTRRPSNVAVDLKDMLDSFLRIRTSGGVLRFARRYGVLLLCEQHGLPAQHLPPEPTKDGLLSMCSPRLDDAGESRLERIGDWTRLVKCARAMVQIASWLHRGELPPDDLWEPLGAARWARPGGGGSVEISKRRLSMHIDGWLEMAGVRPVFDWSEREPALSFGGNTFDLLALQLAQVVAQGSFWICDGCARPYRRDGRRPQRGRRNFCPSCQEDGTAEKLRKRAWRASGREKSPSELTG